MPIIHTTAKPEFTMKYTSFEALQSSVSVAFIIKCSLNIKVKKIIGARKTFLVKEVTALIIKTIDKTRIINSKAL